MKGVYILLAFFSSLLPFCSMLLQVFSAPCWGDVAVFIIFLSPAFIFFFSCSTLHVGFSEPLLFTAPKKAYNINKNTVIYGLCMVSGGCQVCMLLSGKAAGPCIKDAHGFVYYMPVCLCIAYTLYF